MAGLTGRQPQQRGAACVAEGHWRTDAEPRLPCHHLAPATGAYVLDRELVPGDKAELTAPWPLTVDMAELVMPHTTRSPRAMR